MGFWFMFKIQQELNYHRVEKKIKKALKESVSSDQLHYFEISNAQNLPDKVYWVKESKEFRFNNKLYDIVRKVVKNGRVYLACIDDKQEKELFGKLDEHVERYITNYSKTKSEKNHKIEKKASDFYDLPQSVVFFSQFKIIDYKHEKLKIVAGFNSLISPPPKSFFL